ncbi:MAG: tryptophan synthase subunit beta like protein [Gammaproteobacteria bacterium]|nr:tryptophan synthase subunit beta like protein [Gammaproteobacteria bacterium]
MQTGTLAVQLDVEQGSCMFYVTRDAQGAIISLARERSDPAQEEVDVSDPALKAFLEGEEGAAALLAEIGESDLGLVRVIEDLVELLVERNLITFTDLPLAAQSKLNERLHLRDQLTRLHSPMVDEDDIL